MAAALSPIKRRLTFYKWESLDPNAPFDPLATAVALRAVPDAPGRAVPAGDFHFDVFDCPGFSVPDAVGAIVMRYRDYDNRPYTRVPGTAAHPVEIDPNGYILDASHAVIWADGYAAFDQGGHSPGPSAYAAFVRVKLKQLVTFRPLFDKSAIDRLKELAGLRHVQFRMRNSLVTQDRIQSELGPLRGLLQRFFDFRGEVVVATDISVESRGKGARGRVLHDITPADIQQAADRADRLFDSFVVSGIRHDGKFDKVDLFHSRLSLERNVLRARDGGASPDLQSTLTELINARSELEKDERLATAVVAWAEPHADS